MGVTGVSEGPIARPSLANFARRQRVLICRVCGVFGALRPFHVITCDKREAFAQGSEATKQSTSPQAALWIASLRSQ
jgi:hypothetical protein